MHCIWKNLVYLSAEVLSIYFTTFGLLTQERFVELSTNNENEATKGVLGKIKYVANYLASGCAVDVPIHDCFCTEMNYHCHVINSAYDYAWTLDTYRNNISKDSKEWDEMEYSIVANLADNLIVGASANYIDLIAVKKF